MRMLLQLRTVSSMLATVNLVADGSGERRRGKARDVRRGWCHDTRELPSEVAPVVPVLQLRFGAFSRDYAPSFLSSSLSTFPVTPITEGSVFADNRAALRRERDY